MVLIPIQPKIQASKVLEFAFHSTNEYGKEKENNTTILAQNHGEVLKTTSDFFII